MVVAPEFLAPTVGDLPSRHFRPTDSVLPRRMLRSHVQRYVPLSLFGMRRWNLAAGIHRENFIHAMKILDFDRFVDPVQRLTAKEYIMARFNRSVPSIRKRLSPTGAYHEFIALARFYQFLESQFKITRLEAVEQRHLDAYLRHLQRKEAPDAPKPTTLASPVGALIKLEKLGKFLSLDGLNFAPWKGKSAHSILGIQKQKENSTPRIPEPIVQPYFLWAWRYVSIFSKDILAARHGMNRLDAAGQALASRDASADSDRSKFEARQARLLAWIAERRLAGRGMPMHNPDGRMFLRLRRRSDDPVNMINTTLVARTVGIPVGALRRKPAYQGLLREAVNELGWEVECLETPISPNPDTGEPWRAPFDLFSLMIEERMLMTACYVICAYLSGMRDSEVQAMKYGCHELSRSADGLVNRHKVKSTTYKGKGTRGRPAVWVVIEPVAEAIAVLEEMARLRRYISRSRSLFVKPNYIKPGKNDHVAGHINVLLNEFRDHVNELFGTPIPCNDDTGKPWRFQTRQFRRTIAWFIANRPFGNVAGMLQFKQLSVVTFEGYAGTSESGFRAEIEQEEAIARLDDIVEQYEEFRQGVRPGGPAGSRITAEFERVQQELDHFPGVIVDAARVRAMLQHFAKQLFPGILNDCFFEPRTALCLPYVPVDDRTEPVFAHCSPDTCPNSCIRRKHLRPWQGAVADARDKLGTNKRLSDNQKAALRGQIARCERIIKNVDEA